MRRLPSPGRAGFTLQIALLVAGTSVPALAEDSPEIIHGTVTIPATPAAPLSKSSIPSDEEPATAPAAWLDDLAAGYRDAATHQRSILLMYGAEWCGPCRALARETARPEISGKLADWTLVHLDVDKLAGPDRYTGAIPAMRILTSQGKLLAGREGYLSGDELLSWLKSNAPAQVQPDPDLAAVDAPPDATATKRLVAKLSDNDGLVREAAIRRLSPWPGNAAVPVVELFAGGNLRDRLSAMELLESWKAPIDGMDPWTPQTITPQRITALRSWAASHILATTRPSAINQPADAEDLEALLRAASPEEANVITQRLARAGPALLPTVKARMKSASTDRDIERLTALRYSLVAEPALMAEWSGGIQRLASRDASTRHRAAEELADRAKPADEALLGELFADPDPLVRELSLHALQHVGGADADRAMLKLLRDSDPNVRAAVLKELAESPSPDMVNDVMLYVSAEQDPDLVVHAVRVLREAKSPVAEKCLLSLFSHPSWRVRAEAVDGLSDSRQKRSGNGARDDSGGPTDQQVQAALIKLLDDPDGYVAGNAVVAIRALGGENPDMTPLLLAAKRHPKLAMDIVNSLARGRSADAGGLVALRSFCGSEDPHVRRIALKALARVAPNACQLEIERGMADADSGVRIAAADAIFAAMESVRPQNGYVERPAFLGFFGGGRVKVDPVQWLNDFRSGKQAPVWMTRQIPAMQKMLGSADPAEHFPASLPLAALGHDEQAMPVILKFIGSDPSSREPACLLLPWLPWDRRLQFFDVLLATAGSNDNALLTHLSEQMVVWTEPRAADPLWKLLARPEGMSIVGTVSESLRQLYTPQQTGGDDTPAPAGGGAETLAKLKIKAVSGAPAQRVAALSLLVCLFTPDGAQASMNVYQDSQTPAELREDAFYLVLLAQQPDAVQTAVSGLTSNDKQIQLQSLRFLSGGSTALGAIHEMNWLEYSVSSSSEQIMQSGAPAPILIKPPPGLAAEILRPLAASSDSETAADSGYLLCVLGDKSGLPPLLSRWRAEADDRYESPTRRLVYRAISAIDDDSQTPILAEIYGKFDKGAYDLREFYWTIRAMHGPNILALRKKIRAEVGMDHLQ